MARILVVDDERSIRRTLKAFFEVDGHEVAVAEDVREAKGLVQEREFDVVLTDLVLPRESGIELLTWVRRTAPRTQVILMTGQPDFESAASAVRARAFDYLTKPLSGRAIRQVVLEAAAEKAREDESERLREENRLLQENLQLLVEERTCQLRRSEAQFRGIAERCFDLIFTTDRDGVFTYVSPSSRRILGYGPDEVVGRRFAEFLAPGDVSTVSVRFARALRGEDEGVLRAQAIRRNGETVMVEANSSVVVVEGEIVGLQGVVRDISERTVDERKKHHARTSVVG